MDTGHTGYGLYWRIWLVLLVLTAVMIFVDQMQMPRTVLVLVLVSAMLAKATLIAGYFMHLRFEKLFLRLAVLLGLLINGAILYGLISIDGVRIFGMVADR